MNTKTLTKTGKWPKPKTWSPEGEPTAAEDVILPAGALELTAEGTDKCRSLVAQTGYTGIFAFSAKAVLEIGNSEEPPEATILKLISTMTLTMASESIIRLVSSWAGTHKFFSGGRTFWWLTQAQEAAKVKLEEALTATAYTLEGGELNTNGQTVALEYLQSNSVVKNSTLTLGASKVTLTSSGVKMLILGEKCTVVPGTSTVELVGTTAQEGQLKTTGQEFSTLIVAKALSSPTGSLTAKKLQLNTAGEQMSFGNNFAVTVKESITTNAKAGSLVKLKGGLGGNWKLKNETGANVSLDYLELENSTAEGGNCYAGAHSVDLGGNVGWKFEAPPEVVTKTLTGTITPATLLQRSTQKALTGALSPSGALGRTVQHQLAGALSFAGSLPRKTIHALTGSLSFQSFLTGTEVGKYIKHIAASLSFEGFLGRRTSHQLPASLQPASLLGRSTSRQTTGTLTPSGSLSRKSTVSLAASLSFAGTLGRRITARIKALLGLVGRLTPEHEIETETIPVLYTGILDESLYASGASDSSLIASGSYDEPLIYSGAP